MNIKFNQNRSINKEFNFFREPPLKCALHYIISISHACSRVKNVSYPISMHRNEEPSLVICNQGACLRGITCIIFLFGNAIIWRIEHINQKLYFSHCKNMFKYGNSYHIASPVIAIPNIKYF